ncbi:MAG: hypothetical protein ACKOAU_11060 [Pirellula sp.]
MDHSIFKPIQLAALAVVLICSQIACEAPSEVRIYEAPKSESTFVSGPLAGMDNKPSSARQSGPSNPSASVPAASAPAPTGPRRILGAIIPSDQGCYFLKATDSPDRLETLLGDLRTIVENFAIDPQTGRPSNKLPEGWVMNPREDIAIAELISPEATGRVKFTVTALAMPDSDQWQEYLRSNVNRWRGQLKLQELSSEAMLDTLVQVPRATSPLPAYIFDAVGTGSGGMAPQPMQPKADASASKRPSIEYDLPPGWTVGQGSQFRLATLNIDSKEGRGEVTVSMATDNPQANTAMWLQQVAKESDPAKLEPLVQKTIQDAQRISLGGKEATLYEMRASDQPKAPMLLVVSMPTDTPELHLFIKMIGDNQLASAQKDNLIQFVQSLKIK